MVQLSKGYIRDGPVKWISWSFFRSHDQLPDHNEHMANGRNTGMFFWGDPVMSNSSDFGRIGWAWSLALRMAFSVAMFSWLGLQSGAMRKAWIQVNTSPNIPKLYNICVWYMLYL